ncbi:MAG: hypothetical protein IT373_25585 [Polyangiaceae bacterium]|nr:hypothetical protein [Polyangiaceae bacterium]
MRSRTEARLVALPSGVLAWNERLVFRPTGEPYELTIAYPETFPHSPPRAFVLTPSVIGAPHRLIDGSLCLFDNPAVAAGVKTTALLVRNRAVVWFWTFRAWQLTGAWCAPEH